MPPILYYTSGSPPCHLVLLTAKVININLNLKVVDMTAQDHLKPEYLKLNPQHTVPTLIDGFTMSESRAISRYLVCKYVGAGSKLYPQDPRARALIDQRLDFDIGTLYLRFGDYFYPIFEKKQPDESKLKKVEEALGFLNTFLEGNKYAAGDNLTLADLAFVSTISAMEASDINLKPYPNIVRWFDFMKTTLPEYEEVIQKNVDVYKSFVDMCRANL